MGRLALGLAITALGTGGLLVSLVDGRAHAAETANAETAQASPIALWPGLRHSLFAERPISEAADDIVSLEAPKRAEDAATVPVAVHTHLAPEERRQVRKLYLLVDNNPSPLAAVFEFTADSGRADIETRIRIEQYSDVRAIAELDDGSLHMATRFVKASGGCSAPAGKDAEAAARNAGRIKFRVEDPVAAGQPALAQLAISHPNSSGLVLDQVSRLYTPPYYVRTLKISYDGVPIMSADINYSISENPNFRFYFTPRQDGHLRAEIVDTHDLSFTSEVAVKTLAAKP